MNVDLLSLVRAAFASMLVQFNLQLCQSGANKVIVVGTGYAILVWLDRDGISLRYLDLGSPGQKGTADLASYLVKKRRWVIGEKHSRQSGWDADIQFGLHNCALTLMEVGQDILRGEKAWLTDPSVEYSAMHETQQQELSLALARCVSAKNHIKRSI